ncbi:MAG: diaminopimelate epimerase, partial [Crocinitomicaceae bacterium]
MKISFTKYQGTGNDFVMLNNMSGDYSNLSIELISFLCNRKLGIGADGLIMLSQTEKADFYVDYYNADGSQSFCGNGARCSVAFAKEIGLIVSETKFDAIDGVHSASILDGIVRLEMLPVIEVLTSGVDYIVDTGSPHYVHLENENDPGIVEYGKQIRYSESFVNEGINVNYLMSLSNNIIAVKTYERGVEDETLSCGTGVTACALVYMKIHADITTVQVKTKGGELSVEAKQN